MYWHFGPFRLDLANACLWHAAQRVILRPKTFEVLVYLVTHAGQLVTKEALFDAIWPETVVGDGVLKTSMTELRKALGETAKAPQWIATVHRRGYRFVAPVTFQSGGMWKKHINNCIATTYSLSCSEVLGFGFCYPAACCGVVHW